MALHLKKDFADQCGLKTKNLSVYITRGKVIASGDYIDDSIPQNSDFLQKWSEKKGEDIPGEIITEAVIEKPKKELKHSKPVFPAQKIPKVTSPDKKDIDPSVYDMDKKKKAADLLKTETEIEHRRLQIEKLRGELIPTDLAKAFTILHSESIKIAFNEGCENLIVILSAKKQFTATETAEARKELTSIVNKSIDNAIAVTKRSIRNIVMEYSNTKAVGEHG